MIPASLLVIARCQSLAHRLQEAVGDARAHWVPSTIQALTAEVDPAAIVVELPDSGGERAVARLKRRFDAPLLVLLREGQPKPGGAYAGQSRSAPLAILAQVVKEAIHSHAPGVLHAGGLSLDAQARRLQVRDEFHLLRPIGCQILTLLMESPGQTLRREELFRRVWNTEDGDSTRALDVHISHLRQVIEEDPSRPRVLVTERGIGYRIEDREKP